MDNRFLSEKTDDRVLYVAMIPEQTAARVGVARPVACYRISSAVHAGRIVGFRAQVPVKVEQSSLTPGRIPVNNSADKALLQAEWPVLISTEWWY